MTEPRTQTDVDDETAVPSADRDPALLVAEVERLEADLADLRARYAQLHRSKYRRTALALAVISLASFAGAWAFPPSRQLLVVLGGTGLFAAVLIHYLTPERFIVAETGAAVYEALATNQSAIVAELGLSDMRVYLPVSGSPGGVRLFVPKEIDFDVPTADALETRFVITANEDARGVSFVPAASGLMAEFESTLSTGLSRTPSRLATQLVDGLVNGFELVDHITPTVAASKGRARFAVTGSAYGSVEQFDDPVQSFLAVGLARGLGTPVTTTVTVPAGGQADYLVTCEWTPGADLAAGEPDDSS